MKPVALAAIGVVALGVAAFVLWPRAAEDATLYCSVDQDQSTKIVEEFQKASGHSVRLVGESEAARSVGITQKLYLEKDRPEADVLWANEIMNTVYLRDAGLLAPLPAGIAEEFPPAWRDRKASYVAFAARARILLVNTKLLPDPKEWPTSVEDLLDPKWGGAGRGVAVAAPLTGTTYTHAVVLLTRNAEAGQKFWKAIAERSRTPTRGLKVVPGNGAVREQVENSENGIAWGLTDTDDAHEAILKGAPVAVVYPDQAAGGVGTLVIPNTLAMVRGGPHREAGEKLIRWLATKENERRLAFGQSASIPLRDDVEAPDYVKRPGKDFRAMEVDWAKVGAQRDRWQGVLQSMFMK